MRRILLPWAIMLGLVLSLAAQERPRLNARDLFLLGMPSSTDQGETPAATAGAPLGLRWAVLKADPAGRFSEANFDTVFRTGDRIRFNIQVNDSGYLYIVARGASGNWNVLFPSPQINGGSNRVEKAGQYQIPEEPNASFTFTPPAGVESFFIVLSRQPVDPSDTLPAVPARLEASRAVLVQNQPVDDAVINRLRNSVRSRDVVLTKAENGSASDAALYAANAAAKPEDWVVADLILHHR